MRWMVLLALCAGAAQADVRFEDMSARLPAHVYEGGWEHFVGGGVAVFDCNGDALPDIFAAGGENPATLIRSEGDFEFTQLDVPEIFGAAGAYPIDLNGDGMLDLFVLRVDANVVLKGQGACQFADATGEFGLPNADQWSTGFTAWWDNGETRATLALATMLIVPTLTARSRPVTKTKFCAQTRTITHRKS